LREEADAAYAQAIAMRPSLAGDESWRSDPGLASRFESIVRDAMALTTDRKWEIALMAGQPALARRLAHEAGDPEFARLFVAAWLLDPGSLEELKRYALSRPRDAGVLAWSARALAHAGDGSSAGRLRTLARVMSGSDDAAAYETRFGDGSVDESATGSSASAYGTLLYRRPTPPDLLPPDVPRLQVVDLAASDHERVVP
jgi:hypothetical protein